MSNTYSQVSIHCVFAVKGKASFISTDFQDELHQYMYSILRNDGIFPLAIGGRQDHVHVFFELPVTISISDLVRELKTTSAEWINDNHFINGKFQWQEGFSAFSYAHSQRETMIHYILHQERHHAAKTFKDEYLELMTKFDIHYDEQYIFDFYE